MADCPHLRTNTFITMSSDLHGKSHITVWAPPVQSLSRTQSTDKKNSGCCSHTSAKALSPGTFQSPKRAACVHSTLSHLSTSLCFMSSDSFILTSPHTLPLFSPTVWDVVIYEPLHSSWDTVNVCTGVCPVKTCWCETGGAWIKLRTTQSASQKMNSRKGLNRNTSLNMSVPNPAGI